MKFNNNNLKIMSCICYLSNENASNYIKMNYLQSEKIIIISSLLTLKSLYLVGA